METLTPEDDAQSLLKVEALWQEVCGEDKSILCGLSQLCTVEPFDEKETSLLLQLMTSFSLLSTVDRSI